MKKKKLLTAVAILFCLGIAGVVLAREVISIDLNAYGNKVAYSGNGAVDSTYAQVWRAYYGGTNPEGWGKPMGAPRSVALVDYNEPCMPSFYSSQVWIGDPCAHAYFGSTTGTGLLSDGFAKSGGGTDPCIILWGVDAYGKLGHSQNYPNPPIDSNIVPYPGDPNYDIYVYGPNDGNFTVSYRIHGTAVSIGPSHITGGGSDRNFVQGQNYVVFQDIPVDSNYNDGNYVAIKYSNKISGLQLVKRKDPVVMKKPETKILARTYDVAYDTNRRTSAEFRVFGPDINEANNMVTSIDRREQMTYDFTVDDGNAGVYMVDASICVAGSTGYGEGYVDLFLDDVNIGTVTLTTATPWPPVYTTYPDDGKGHTGIMVKLLKGSHTIMWRAGARDYEPAWGFDMNDLRFRYVEPNTPAGDANLVDCNEVYKYGYNYAEDFTTGANTGIYAAGRDCHVNFDDFAIIASKWLTCQSPDGICQ